MSLRSHRVGVRQVDDVWVLTLPRELGAEVEESLVPATERALDHHPRRLVVDFSRVAFANSAGIGALVDLLRRAREKNVLVALAAASGQPSLIIERVGIPRFATMCQTVEEALVKDPGP